MKEVLQNQPELEDKMVEDAFQQLVDSYLTTKHRKKIDLITKAFNFAKHAHKGVRRLSGEPYIMHPIAVAQIVCSEIGLGSTSICSALLHDVVEDTDYTVEDIENMFGAKIAQIVDGLTKISGGIFGDHASAQAENFKKLLLTMSDDIRVILIKIADRLHNMRTLGAQAPNKRYKIAGETLYIYAPLANRLGLNKIKVELEDLSFRYEHPEEYESIRSKLADTQAERDNVFATFTAPIRQQLDSMGVHGETFVESDSALPFPPSVIGAIAWILIWAIIVFCPNINLLVRRVHDFNTTGWLVLLPFVFSKLSGIVQLVFGFIPGTKGPNKYGPQPMKR